MPVVKTYRTYPIHRDRDGTYTVEVRISEHGVPVTQGQFESLKEAEEFADELLVREEEKFRPHASSGK
jgi:hypothetical protein